MNKTCKRCGLPIKVNKDMCEAFEDMHWLCFHMEFEHGNYDPDEACDDPSCPWNRISGNDLMIIYSYSDIKVLAENCISGVFINKKEIENYRMPSIKLEIVIVDEYIRKYSDMIWIEKEKLESFVKQLKVIWDTGKGEAVLRAMSEEDFTMRILTVDSLGHIAIAYKVRSYKYVESYMINYSFENGFQVEFNKLEKLINSINLLLGLF